VTQLLEDAVAVENKASNTHVLNVNSQDHKFKEKGGNNTMGEVIALIRLMPGDVISDEEITTIENKVKEVIKEPVKLGRVEIKNVAFGLKGLDVTVAVPDSEGGLDPVVEVLSKIDKIESVEVVDVGRI
jgi:translation elongation factor aEF-1 beta